LALRAKRIAAFFVLSFVIFGSSWLKNGVQPIALLCDQAAGAVIRPEHNASNAIHRDIKVALRRVRRSSE